MRPSTMRWDDLFDDLESQLESELSAEEVDLLAEEERLRLARLDIRDRLRSLDGAVRPHATSDRMLRLVLADGSRVNVVPSSFGQDWLAGELLEGSGRRAQCIVPIDSIDGIILERNHIIQSLELRADETPGALSARLGLAFVLRDVCRRRASVELRLKTTALSGTIDRVGRDHLDIAVHEPGEPRRDSMVSEYRIVRLTDLVLVRF